MSPNSKTILFRFTRSLAAIAVAAFAAFVVGPDFLSIVPDAYDNYIVVFGAPLLLALEKFLRDGGDAQS